MQEGATDVSRINHTGNPEGVVSANPSSLSHDPVSGNIYAKATGTGNTGWVLLGTVNIVTPFKVSTLIDDFYETLATPDPGTSISPVGQLGWSTNGFLNGNGTNTNPGVAQQSGNAANSYMWLTDANTRHSVAVGGGVIQINYVLSLVTLSVAGNRYTCNLGLMDDGVSPTNAIYFSYIDNVNSGNWVINCKSGGTTTSVNTSTPAVTGFVNLGITINAAGTSVAFTINGVAVGSAITTNIPTSNLSPAINFIKSAGNLPASLLDLFVLTNTLTASR